MSAPGNRQAPASFIVRPRRHGFRDFGLDRRKTIRQIVQGPPTLGSALGTVHAVRKVLRRLPLLGARWERGREPNPVGALLTSGRRTARL